MDDNRRNYKYCNSEIVGSDKEDGFYHAFEINDDLHNCRSKRRGYP